MVFVRIFVCLVLCFVLANCYGNKMLFRRQSINYEVVGNHEFGTQKFYSNIIVHKQDEEHCKEQNFTRALKSNMMFFKCQPRDAVVHLHAKENNVEMIPNKVVVKRCYESGCYGMNSCLPSKTKEVKVAVRLNYRVAKQQKCSWVMVTEHTECKCGCKVTRQECEKNNKEFSPKECTCKCRNDKQRKACIKQENMAWDEESCTCMCQTQYMECSTGAVWVPQYCKCMQVMMSDEDRANQKFVYNTR